MRASDSILAGRVADRGDPAVVIMKPCLSTAAASTRVVLMVKVDISMMLLFWPSSERCTDSDEMTARASSSANLDSHACDEGGVV